jgi:hypothetical protein
LAISLISALKPDNLTKNSSLNILGMNCSALP